MVTTANEWVRELQRQATAVGQPYDASEAPALADAAHAWALYHGARLSLDECAVAAEQLLEVAWAHTRSPAEASVTQPS